MKKRHLWLKLKNYFAWKTIISTREELKLCTSASHKDGAEVDDDKREHRLHAIYCPLYGDIFRTGRWQLVSPYIIRTLRSTVGGSPSSIVERRPNRNVILLSLSLVVRTHSCATRE